MVEEAPDDKSEEKQNFIRGMFSSLLLSDASLIILAANFVKISHKKRLKRRLTIKLKKTDPH